MDKAYVHLISSYLAGRLTRLKVNHSHSEKHLTRSAPQGGGLSPFLWNSDFDDMLGTYSIDQNVFSDIVESNEVENNVQAFADDSQVLVISDSLFLCQLAANYILEQLNRKAQIKKMTYNTPKSKAVVFSQRNIPFNIDIRLRGEKIETRTKAMLLGVTMDSKLCWSDHIDTQSAKCKRLIFLLNRCCKLKWGISKEVIKNVGWVHCTYFVIRLSNLDCFVRKGYHFSQA